MIEAWINTLISVFIVSLLSFSGVFTLTYNEKKLKQIILFLVSFSTGALLGDAFIHLLPELIEEAGFTFQISLMILLGVLIFFILEKFVHWRHCHVPTSEKHPHPLAIMNLVGDSLHNLMDGMIIAGSFLVNFKVGLATSVAVVLHEIPQEIGDLGVLLHAGMKRAKVLFYNFLSAVIAIVGAIIVLVLGETFVDITEFIIPITIGGFIYIASSDLIPELHKETEPKKSLLQLFGILLGIGVMAALLLLE